MLVRRATPAEFAQVELVGGEDEIELMEIGGMHLAGAQRRQVIPADTRMPHGARIRRIADVVVLRSGGIELDAQAGLPGFDMKYWFGIRF